MSESASAPAPATPGQRNLVLVAAILASSLGFIDGAVVSVAIPAIRSDLGASFTDIQWVANAYTLLLSALILVGGAAGDRFGLRLAFAGGIGVFALTSIGCALSGSAGQLIAWRAAQGAGAAFMVPGSLALIARTFPPDTRGAAIGLWSMASGIAAALGPILGGLLIEYGGPTAWRWVFWLNPPIGALTIALVLAAADRNGSQAGKSLDVLGAILVTLGLGGISWGLTQASDAAASTTAIVLPFLAGLVFVGAFLAWEKRAKEPMMPLSLFGLRTFNGANLLTFFLYFALAGSLFFLPMTLIQALHLPEGEAGSVYLPFTLMMALVARLSGRMTDRLGPRLPLTWGSIIVGLSFLAAAVGVYSEAFVFGVIPAMVLLGVGMGLVVAPLSTTVMTVADDALAGTASGINNGISRIAGLFAVAVLGVIAAFVFRREVDPMLSGVGFGQPQGPLADWPASRLYVEGMLKAFVAVSLVTAVLAFLSAGIAWRMLPRKTKT